MFPCLMNSNERQKDKAGALLISISVYTVFCDVGTESADAKKYNVIGIVGKITASL